MQDLVQGLPQGLGQRISRAFRATIVAVGGGLVILGSVLPWATYDFMFSQYESSGVSMGYGLATLPLGLSIGLIGITTAIGRGTPRLRRVVTALAVLTLLVVLSVAALLQMRLGEPDPERSVGPFFVSHEVGLYIVGVGAAMAAIAGFATKRRR